jgi:chromosome segregation ATPase
LVQVEQLMEELSGRLEQRFGGGSSAAQTARAEAATERLRLESRLADCQEALAATEEALREAKAEVGSARGAAAGGEEERRAALDRVREALAVEHSREMDAAQAEHRRATQQQTEALWVCSPFVRCTI